MDPATLQQLATMEFDEMHIPCDIRVAALPCSSANGRLGSGQAEGTCLSKEFIIILSYITGEEGLNAMIFQLCTKSQDSILVLLSSLLSIVHSCYAHYIAPRVSKLVRCLV